MTSNNILNIKGWLRTTLTKVVEEAQREACAGKFFNKVDIVEEMHIPDELIRHIAGKAVEIERERIVEWAKTVYHFHPELLEELIAHLSDK